MNVIDVYGNILRDLINKDSNVEDVLFLAVVLHSHSIALRTDIVLDDGRRIFDNTRHVLPPLTRNHVAQLISELWPKSEERGQLDFWFFEYAYKIPYELFEDVPNELLEQAQTQTAKRKIEEHRLVEGLIPE